MSASNSEEIADEMGVNALGSPSHIVLFEAADPFADSGFDFAERFHSDLRPALVATASLHGERQRDRMSVIQLDMIPSVGQ